MEYSPFIFSSGAGAPPRPTTRLEALQHELEEECLRVWIMARNRKIAERMEVQIRLETELEIAMIRRLSAAAATRPPMPIPPSLWRPPLPPSLSLSLSGRPLLVPHPSPTPPPPPPTTSYYRQADYLVDEGIEEEEEEEEVVVEEMVLPMQAVGMADMSSRKRKFREVEEKEWGCALCQVAASSEEALNLHLQGKKHLARAAAEFKGVKKNIAGGGDLKGKAAAAAAAMNKCGGGKGKAKGKGKKEAAEDGKGWRKVSVQVDGKLYQVIQKGLCMRCEACDVRSYGNSVMVSHLSGKKHRDAIGKSSD